MWQAAFVASLAVLAFGIWFQVSMKQHWTGAPLPYGLRNPCLAMQMAKEPWPAEMLDPGQNRAEIARQQHIDYGYIPSYVALFLFVAILQSNSSKRWVAALGPISIVLTLVGATYDLSENRAILAVTELGDASAWMAIRPNSLGKWGCVFLVILLQSLFYFTVPMRGVFARVLARIVGAAALAAGSIGLWNSITGNEMGIAMATLPLLVTVIAMPVFLLLGWRNALP